MLPLQEPQCGRLVQHEPFSLSNGLNTAHLFIRDEDLPWRTSHWGSEPDDLSQWAARPSSASRQMHRTAVCRLAPFYGHLAAVLHDRRKAEDVGLPASAALTAAVLSAAARGDYGYLPLAINYGGHQFGSWAGQLGDGRVATVGATVVANRSLEVQLKGLGPTPFSRDGDGFASFGDCLREYLYAHALNGCGIPSTTAVAVLACGERVGTSLQKNAVLCRVAPSFLRVGSFELPARRGEHETLRSIADFARESLFGGDNAAAVAPDRGREGRRGGDYVLLLSAMIGAMAAAAAAWQAAGFVHGTLNTDNLSVAGLALDLGGSNRFIQNYDPEQSPNAADAARRYRFSAQPEAFRWGAERLAESFCPLIGPHAVHDAAKSFEPLYRRALETKLRAKLGLGGLNGARRGQAMALATELLELMAEAGADYTNTWRALAALPLEQQTSQAREAGDRLEWLQDTALGLALAPKGGDQCSSGYWERLSRWVDWYREVGGRTEKQGVNPVYVLRSWMVERAVRTATEGDFSEVNRLVALLERPFAEQEGAEEYLQASPPQGL